VADRGCSYGIYKGDYYRLSGNGMAATLKQDMDTGTFAFTKQAGMKIRRISGVTIEYDPGSDKRPSSGRSNPWDNPDHPNHAGDNKP
jgi:hypothetical protein